MLLLPLISIFTSVAFRANGQFDTFDSGALFAGSIGGVPIGHLSFSRGGRQSSSAYAVSFGNADVKFHKKTGWMPPAIAHLALPAREIAPVEIEYTRPPPEYPVVKTTNYAEDYKPSTIAPPVKPKPCRNTNRQRKTTTKAPYYPLPTEASTKAHYYPPPTEASTKAPYYLPLKVHAEAPYSAPAVVPEKIIVDDLYYQPNNEQPYPITDLPIIRPGRPRPQISPERVVDDFYFPPIQDPVPIPARYPPADSVTRRPPRLPIKIPTVPPVQVFPTRRFPNRRPTLSPSLEPSGNFPGFFQIPEAR